MSDDQIPSYIFDYITQQLIDQTEKANAAHAEILEMIRHDATQENSLQIQVLECIIYILQHPNGGVDAAIKFINEHIEIIKKSDEEID